MFVLQTLARIALIGVLTVVGGALCGGAASAAMYTNFSCPVSTWLDNIGAGLFGIIYAAPVGLLASAFTIPLLIWKRIALAVPLVFTPAFIVAGLCGAVGKHEAGVALSAFGSVGTLLLASIAAFVWMPNCWPKPVPPHLCRQCKYDLRNLRAGRCPECGARISRSRASSLRRLSASPQTPPG
ncbi:MAG TPA: hypothetical protein VG797_05585 [Phycisphaerales bacterium]|nr:hypothetical protein [Phycisphaerales bacterium]